MSLSIGETDILSIGRTYIGVRHTPAMVKIVAPATYWGRLQLALKKAKRESTQEYAARLFGVKQPTISGTWNKKGKAPEIDKILEHAKELNVCVEWLATGDGPMHPLPKFDSYAEELWAVWDRLDDTTRRAIAGYAVGKASGIEQNLDGPLMRESTPRSRIVKRAT